MEKLHIDLAKHFDANAIIHYKSDKTSDVIKYSDLKKEILKISPMLLDEEVPRHESYAIGILCDKSPTAIALMLSCLEADFAFCFISKDDIPKGLARLGIKAFLTDDNFKYSSDYSCLDLRNFTTCFGRTVYFYRSSNGDPVRFFRHNNDPNYRICYNITTSGSVQKKIVRVTFKSIASNIIALQRIFQLNKDVIHSSAPCTFDVFMLDVFLALHSGSALMIIDESRRYSDDSLNFMFLSQTPVTFMQITPSLFQRYGMEHIKNRFMDPRSSLK